MNSVTPASSSPAGDYSVGTLTYDKRSLRALMAWLLLGDFCMSLCDSAIPRLIPLELDRRGTGAGQIGWVMSIGPLIALILSPFIGVWSDRLRTRFGRRRPIAMLSTPVMGLGMMALPFTEGVYSTWACIALIQVGLVLQTVVLYLYADVVPAVVMGRFMGWFKLFGIAGVMTFQGLVFPQFESSPAAVWVCLGLLYLVLFQVTLHNVREGEYPPPETFDLRNTLKGYVKHGMGTRYIWLLWLVMGMSALGNAGGYFRDLFATKQLGLSMETIGRFGAMAIIPAMLLALPAGWMIDKFGPRRLWGGGCFAAAVGLVLAYFFVTGPMTYAVFLFTNSMFDAVMGIVLMPMLYAHIPRNRFGQIVSAQSFVVQAMMFVSSNLCGQLIAWSGNNYRIGFLYSAFFLLHTPLFVWLLSRAANPFAGEAFALNSVKESVCLDVPLAGEAKGHPLAV